MGKQIINRRLLMMVVLFTGVLLVIASYAWFSASLNVKVKFFDLVVSSDSGLFISLDGVNYASEIELSKEKVVSDLKQTYPGHTNQWAAMGLWPVSSIGIKGANDDKFAIYQGEVSRYRVNGKRIKLLNTMLIEEEHPRLTSSFIGFDLFFKNVSGSPRPDNLYLEGDSYIEFDEEMMPDDKRAMQGLMDSLRVGFLKIGSVPLDTSVSLVQGMKCNHQCEALIFEPNSTAHAEVAIMAAKELGITLEDGVYTPTYAVIKAGARLEHVNGHVGTGIPLDTEHFQLQQTRTEADYERPLFEVPHGVTKVRIYLWLEGQDIDSLETNSRGAALAIGLNLVKDLAGYE